jgi:hypothetical protein
VDYKNEQQGRQHPVTVLQHQQNLQQFCKEQHETEAKLPRQKQPRYQQTSAGIWLLLLIIGKQSELKWETCLYLFWLRAPSIIKFGNAN